MALKKILVIHHVDYAAGEVIARNQVQELIRRLASYSREPSLIVLTAPTECTRKTAEAICQALNINQFVESDILLWTNPEHVDRVPRSLELISQYQEGAQILILVTHTAYTGWLPTAFAKRILGVSIDRKASPCACGWVVDCDKKTIDAL